MCVCTSVGWHWGWLPWLLRMLLCAFLRAFFSVHLAVPCGILAGCVVPGHRLHMFSAFPFIAKSPSKVVAWVAAHPVSTVPELALIKLESIEPANQMEVSWMLTVRIAFPSSLLRWVAVAEMSRALPSFCELSVYITLHILSGRFMSYAC